MKSGGSDHSPTFISKLKILDVEFSAEGKSKKEAQKEVAKIVLDYLAKH
jgi:dsRNA-specific ribonuclease